MANTARELIWPKNKDIIARAVFLYAGQGESTIILLANGDTYRTALIDINLDLNNGGINVPYLISDLLEPQDKHLDIFVNTHPHNDHLSGVIELCDAVNISEVWHSGHKPGKKHGDAYNNLHKVIDKVKESKGLEILLTGSKGPKSIGEVDYYVFSPASYVVDDIEGETEEERYRRIHEQCAVIKFGKGSKWIMITGDADRDAWEKHITDYHKDRLQSTVLSAPHHGSITFFKNQDEDKPYLDALQQISPTYVIVSAPKSNESPHGHPDDEAISLYTAQVGDKENVLHTGKQRYSFICDIFRDEELSIQEDSGKLAEEYGLATDAAKRKSSVSLPPVVPPVDSRPMGEMQ